MELPPEIRNHIYSYLFLPQRVYIIRAKDDQDRFYRLYHKQLRVRDPETQFLGCIPRYYSSFSRSSFPHKPSTLYSIPQNKPTSNKSKKKTEARKITVKDNSNANGHENQKAMTKSTKVMKAMKHTKPTKAMATRRKCWPPQLALLYTCKQTANDTVGLLYSCTQFVFSSPKAIARFMKHIPAVAKIAITHIELIHNMYNEPRLSEYRPIKLRSDHNWFIMCETMADKFPSLSVLHVNLTVFDAPIKLEVGEGWSLPLLVFSGKAGKKENGKGKDKGNGGGLRFVRVKLQYPKFPAWEVRHVERELEARLTDPVALQMREDAKLAREMSKPVKATKVLRLTFN
ncbi:hypothetical protein BJY01DRAFT_248566 [Aspergillus pseudoustus]|uniref:DUF7730 domain-containing protein n=1 Tax=Aspergillus pseudoustus TaxID=1810923 RepID=A0ABR4JV11_9EURO